MTASCFCLPRRRSASLHLRLLHIHPVAANRGQHGGKRRHLMRLFKVFKCNLKSIFNVGHCRSVASHGSASVEAALAIIPFQISHFRFIFLMCGVLLTLDAERGRAITGLAPITRLGGGGGLNFIYRSICGAARRAANMVPKSQHPFSPSSPQWLSAACRIIGRWVDRLTDLIVNVASARLMITVATADCFWWTLPEHCSAETQLPHEPAREVACLMTLGLSPPPPPLVGRSGVFACAECAWMIQWTWLFAEIRQQREPSEREATKTIKYLRSKCSFSLVWILVNTFINAMSYKSCIYNDT